MSDIEQAMRAAREEREAKRRDTAARRAGGERRARSVDSRIDEAEFLPAGSPAAIGQAVGGTRGNVFVRSSTRVPDRTSVPRPGAVRHEPSSDAANVSPFRRTGADSSVSDSIDSEVAAREPEADATRPAAPVRGVVPGSRAPLAESGDTRPTRTIELPFARLAEEGFLTPGIRKGRLSEEYRRVKRPILRNIDEGTRSGSSVSGCPNVVAITSSVAGEGKTFTAISLAMSLAAERERTVVLIDADVLKGTAGRTLGIGNEHPGLTDLLSSDGGDVADVMLGTDVPNLRVVPAGRPTDQANELLSSARMRDVIDELATRYTDRVIVLDCPPMLQTNEANVIVEHAGQIVFVVAGQETEQRLVLEAMRRFDEHKSVGILLNKAGAKGAGYGHDYGYGHD